MRRFTPWHFFVATMLFGLSHVCLRAEENSDIPAYTPAVRKSLARFYLWDVLKTPPKGNALPTYPEEERARGERGFAQFWLVANAQGTAAEIYLMHCSRTSFAKSAYDALRAWQFPRSKKPRLWLAAFAFDIEGEKAAVDLMQIVPQAYALAPHTLKKIAADENVSPEGTTDWLLAKTERAFGQLPGYRSVASLKEKTCVMPVVVRAKGVPTPEWAAHEGQTPSALVTAYVDAKGVVMEAFALRASNPRLAPEVVAAVKRWRFTPGRVDGEAASWVMVIPITFGEFQYSSVQPGFNKAYTLPKN